MAKSLIFYDLAQAQRYISSQLGKKGGKSKSKKKLDAIAENLKLAHKQRKIVCRKARAVKMHNEVLKEAYTVCNIFKTCESKECEKCEEYLEHAEK